MTIVMNTKTGAVSEHAVPFAQVTAGFAASVSGLFALGGNADASASIPSTLETPKVVLQDATQRNLVSDAYMAIDGAGHGAFTVVGKSAQWAYQFAVLASGVSRIPLGRGIKENYLGFRYQNTAGADFNIERIEVRTFKAQRRV